MKSPDRSLGTQSLPANDVNYTRNSHWVHYCNIRAQNEQQRPKYIQLLFTFQYNNQIQK